MLKEDHFEFQTSLGYITRPFQKEGEREGRRKGGEREGGRKERRKGGGEKTGMYSN